MLGERGRRYINPETTATCWSKMFFCWLIPMIKLSLSKGLEEENMCRVLSSDESESLGNLLEYYWECEKLAAVSKTRTPSIRRALIRMFFHSYCVFGFSGFVQIAIGAFIPILTAEIIFYQSNMPKIHALRGWSSLGLLLLCSLIRVILSCHGNLGFTRMAFRCRTACASLIYRKLLKLSVSSLATMSAEDVISLLTTEVYKFEAVVAQSQYLWILPCQLVVVSILLYAEAGYSTVCGCACIILQGVVVNGTFAVIIRNYKKKIVVLAKKRINVLVHFIANIRAIKMYGCEDIFKQILARWRRMEMKQSRSMLYIFGLAYALTCFCWRTAILLPLGISMLENYSLPSHEVYATVLFFIVLQLQMTVRLPSTLESYIDAKAAAKKVQNFLLLPEKSSVRPNVAGRNRKKNGYVMFDEMYASWWYDDRKQYTLENINLEIQPGSLYCVIGEKGSGKSSLLLSVLNEIPIYKGQVHKVGSVSYTSQEPWLFAASIKQNIVFGEHFFRQQYKEVIKVCGVTADLNNLEYGDRTVYNENVQLERDVRARINLARGVYRESDIYLLDEPFGCIEPELGKALFEETVLKYLANKTRIMATRHESFLSSAQAVVVMKNGRIIGMSTFALIPRSILPKLRRSALMVPPPEDSNPKANDVSISELSLTIDTFEKGHMTLKSMLHYIEMFNRPSSNCIYAAFLFFSQLAIKASDVLLMYIIHMHEFCNESALLGQNGFASANPGHEIISAPRFFINTNKDMGCKYKSINEHDFAIYAGTIFLALTLLIARIGWFCYRRVVTSRKLYNLAVANILDCPLEFFKMNTPSSVIGRFSKDINIVDNQIPKSLLQASMLCLTLLGIFFIVAALFPLTIVLTAFLVAVVIRARRVYIIFAEDLTRICSSKQQSLTLYTLYTGQNKSRLRTTPNFNNKHQSSPPQTSQIISKVTNRTSEYIVSTYEGITTIRSFNAEYLITRDFDSLQDLHTYPYVIWLLSNKMLGLYLDLICIVYLMLVVIQSMYVPTYFGKNGAAIGMLMVEVIFLVGTLPFAVNLTARVNMDMYNVQKLLHYVHMDVDVEMQVSHNIKRRTSLWPIRGHIQFKNVFEIHSFFEQDEIYGMDLEIFPGEKIAISGVTYSGKWAVASAMFRLDRQIGSIFVDDVDMASLTVDQVRNSLGIFPREPLLIPTTIRENLNIYEQFTDQELWDVIQKVELASVIQSLDTEVDVKSDMFTYEQKHLFSLARLLLAKRKICIIEDWAYEVDFRVEELIWDRIMTNLSDSTIIVISKRQSVVSRCDRTIVFVKGKIVEDGETKNLLADESSALVGTVVSDSILLPLSKYLYKETPRRKSKK